jgi:hypothetical protein
MELLTVKPGQPLYEETGPPAFFFCGYWDGEAHLLRFGPEDGVDDAIRKCKRLRAGHRPGKRLDFGDRMGTE